MIAVRDVQKSAKWYCRLFDAENDHFLEEFDRILYNGKVLLMLHKWNAKEHGAFLHPADGIVGNGFLLWVFVNDLSSVYRKALEMEIEIVNEPKDNPVAGWREFTLKDLDGYLIAVADFQ
jgi:hypothetical protein